jgi:peptidyl-tRNA hydrolase
MRLEAYAFAQPLATSALATFLASTCRARTATPRRPLGTLVSMSAAPPAESPPPAPPVQYVVVRKDLRAPPPAGLGWPVGSVIAQAVHASLAAVWKTKDTAATLAYCNEDCGRQMHTVVLEAKNEDSLIRLAGVLEDADNDHVVWREQPEDFVTAIAAAPYPRDDVRDLFKMFKLMK